MAFLEKYLTIEHAGQALAAGDLDEAESICRQLLKKNKRDPDAVQLQGAIAERRQNLDEALRLYQRCAAIVPTEGHFQYLIGKVLALNGRYGEATDRLDRALLLKPGYPPAVEWKARVLWWNGDYDGAAAVLAPLIEAGGESMGMAKIQAAVWTRQKRLREAADILLKHTAGDLHPNDRHEAGHAAGDALEKLGEHDEAFRAHTEANRAAAVPFDRAAYAAQTDELIEVFSRDFIASMARGGNQSELPVFIAGMPRSGTTLTEQIIDAHPQARGAGEINDIEAMVLGLQAELESTEPWPRCAADLTPQEAGPLARRYLQRLQRLAPGAKRVVNKSLLIYRQLGLIAVLFPRARLIHVHRDPRDTCWSCYATAILPAAHPYITDLADLGFAYREYLRLMAHWEQAIPSPILDVSYEALVDDVESGARRIIEFCGLPWDDRCLAFHATGRVVQTASFEQVRRPIYRSSLGRWRRYEAHLGPLLDELAKDGG